MSFYSDVVAAHPSWTTKKVAKARVVIVVSKVWMLLPKSRRTYRSSHASDLMLNYSTRNEILDNEKGDACVCARARGRTLAVLSYPGLAQLTDRFETTESDAWPSAHLTPARQTFHFYLTKGKVFVWSVRKLGP
jgi:hypothetical protein